MHIVAFALVYLGGNGEEISIMNIIVSVCVCVCVCVCEREREKARESALGREMRSVVPSLGVSVGKGAYWYHYFAALRGTLPLLQKVRLISFFNFLPRRSQKRHFLSPVWEDVIKSC